MTRLRPRFLLAIAFALSGLLAGIGSAVTAHADYGRGAQYQIEISANCNSAQCKQILGTTAGIWLWIELDASGTGNYEGSDCRVTATHDSGDVTWTDTNGILIISGLNLAGGELPPVMMVPDTYGHYVMPLAQLDGLPLPASAQVQVAP